MEIYTGIYHLKYMQESIGIVAAEGCWLDKEKRVTYTFEANDNGHALELAEKHRTTVARIIGLDDGKATLESLTNVRDVPIPGQISRPKETRLGFREIGEISLILYS